MDVSALLVLLGVTPEHAATAALAVVGAASILAAVLPHPAPGSRWAPLRTALDTVAANLGHASNRTVADRLAVGIVAAQAAGEVLASPSSAATPPSAQG